MSAEVEALAAVNLVLKVHDAAVAMNRTEGFDIFDPSYQGAAFIAALEAQDPPFTVVQMAQLTRVGDEERLRALSDAATPGPWKARTGHPADTFEPDGYKYVQFGPTEAKATGLGTDQLKPADADLIAAAVNYVRERLAPQPPSPASQGEER